MQQTGRRVDSPVMGVVYTPTRDSTRRSALVVLPNGLGLLEPAKTVKSKSGPRADRLSPIAFPGKFCQKKIGNDVNFQSTKCIMKCAIWEIGTSRDGRETEWMFWSQGVNFPANFSGETEFTYRSCAVDFPMVYRSRDVT